VFWDGPILVFVARTGVRTCRCALGRPTLVGAMLVGRWTPPSVLRWWQLEKAFSADETVSATRGPTSGSLALMSGSRPSSGDANESLPAVASALGPSLLLQRSLAITRSLSSRRLSDVEVVHTRGSGRRRATWKLSSRRPSDVGGCSYLRDWNRSSVCNGTLSAGACSLWLSGPEHLGILGAISCFFLISNTRTRLSAS
jgi:hypothetical protein